MNIDSLRAKNSEKTILDHTSILVLATLTVYGLFSSPTPDSFGYAEISTAVLLMALIIRNSQCFIYKQVLYMTLWSLCGITALLTAATLENEIYSIIRDVIPYLYLILPCLAFRKNSHRIVTPLITGLLVTGFIFSIRYLIIDDISILEITQKTYFGDLNYYPLEPAVTFASCFCLVRALSPCKQSLTERIVFLFIGITCLAALAGILLRAPLVLIALAVIYENIRRKSSILRKVFFLTTITVIAIGTETTNNLALLIINKFQAVGFNSKGTEVLDIITAVSNQGIFFQFTGLGFGSEYYSSAATSVVRFSHSFFGYNYLKFGFFGFIFYFLIIKKFYLFPSILLISRKNHSLTEQIIIASLVSLTSPLFLQGSFKSLTFGFIALLIILVTKNQQLNRNTTPNLPEESLLKNRFTNEKKPSTIY